MALPKPPTNEDLPSSITLDIIPSPAFKPPVNVLILLHGLGDTNASFTSLARQLNLPETTCISICGPTPIPPLFTGSDRPAFCWGDDVLVDERTGEVDVEGGGFSKSLKMLGEVVTGLEKGGWRKRQVLFLGFGQGGMAALSVASSLSSTEEYGGVISIGGKFPSSSTSSGKARTPILVLGGSRSTQVTRGSVDGLKERFSNVEYVKWEKADDSMPRSREEMLPIMKFFARRLGSRSGVPNGAVEV